MSKRRINSGAITSMIDEAPSLYAVNMNYFKRAYFDLDQRILIRPWISPSFLGSDPYRRPLQGSPVGVWPHSVNENATAKYKRAVARLSQRGGAGDKRRFG